MTVIKVKVQACRPNVHNEQDAGEHRDQCKLIISTEQITCCLKLAPGRLLFLFLFWGAGTRGGV